MLRKTVYSGELSVGEFASYDDYVRCDAVNTVAWLVPMTRLQKVTLNITLASFARNYSSIFGAASRTTVKYLYMDIVSDLVALGCCDILKLKLKRALPIS